MQVFHRITDLVEPLSLDEAYLDITGPVNSEAYRWHCLGLENRVNRETGLTLSVGVGTSKSVAKIASDLQSPTVWWWLPRRRGEFSGWPSRGQALGDRAEDRPTTQL